MKTMTRPWLLLLVPLLGLLPGAARAAPAASADHHGLLLRAGGDLRVGADELASAVVVLGGNAEVSGRVGKLLVVGGDAILAGAEVDDVTVIRGRAVLHDGTRVTGDLRLIDSGLERDPLVDVGGRILRESSPRWRLSSPSSLLIALGLAAALVLAGLLAVVVAPGGMARAAEAIRETPARSFVAAAAVFALVPPLALVCARTIVGTPVGLGALFIALPGLAFLGFLVAGHALGRQLLALGGTRRTSEAHPFLAVALGLVTLLLFCAVPVAGPLVAVLATFFGAGGLLVLGGRALRGWRRDPMVRPPDPTVPLPRPAQPAAR